MARKKTTPKPKATPVWEQYVEDALSGKIVVGRFVRLACERWKRDVEQAEAKGYYFDEKAAQNVIDFFGYCNHSKGEWVGQPIKLEPWQQFVLANVFGWKRKVDGTRRFREAYVKVGRGNGKTTMLAGLGLYGLLADDEGGPEIYCFATKEDQAWELWKEAERMRDASPELTQYIEKSHKALFIKGTAGKFQYLGSDSQTQDGKRPHFGLCDELHAHPNRSMYDVIKSGMGTRRQPLMFTITTAGFAKTSYCREVEEMGEKILQQILADDRFFFYIASINYDPTHKEDELDERGERYNDDYKDEKNWVKANPNLNVSVKMDFLRAELTTAENNPSSLNNFLTKYMDLWVSQVKRWMPMDKWAKCSGFSSTGVTDALAWRAAMLTNLKGREAYWGLDLSEKLDITALAGIFPPKPKPPEGVQDERRPFEKKYVVLPFFWIPRETMLERAKADKVPYDVWEREGFVKTTEGNAVDYDFIKATILELKNVYKFKELGYDGWNATQFALGIQKDGMKGLVEVGQGYKSLSEPSKELLTKVVKQEIEHGNNPVLTWMASNVAVTTDPAGNIKPDKDKSAERIDGVVATVMGLSRAIANAGEKKTVPRIFSL